MPDIAAPAAESIPPDWDCGQRHTGRSWPPLLAGVALLGLDVVAVSMAPFLLAQSDEPLAVWTVLALLAGMSAKWLFDALWRPIAHLEQVRLGSTGVVLEGVRLRNPLGVYEQFKALIVWPQVRSIVVPEPARKGETGAIVELTLHGDTPLGREFRLVHAKRQQAEALAARAQALHAQGGSLPA